MLKSAKTRGKISISGTYVLATQFCIPLMCLTVNVYPLIFYAYLDILAVFFDLDRINQKAKLTACYR